MSDENVEREKSWSEFVSNNGLTYAAEQQLRVAFIGGWVRGRASRPREAAIRAWRDVARTLPARRDGDKVAAYDTGPTKLSMVQPDPSLRPVIRGGLPHFATPASAAGREGAVEKARGFIVSAAVAWLYAQALPQDSTARACSDAGLAGAVAAYLRAAEAEGGGGA